MGMYKTGFYAKISCFAVVSILTQIGQGFAIPAAALSATQCNAGQYYDNERKKCIGCPSLFPKADPGATSKNDCYTEADNQKLYRQYISCKAGQYLPSKSNACVKCKTDSRYYCPGNRFYPSLTEDRGLQTCPSGKVANEEHTACVSKSAKQSTSQSSAITCEPGKYIPRGWTYCTGCRSGDRYYCPGGTFVPSETESMGLKECPDGMISNGNGSTSTGCMEPTLHCDPGQYLASRAKKCRDCVRYYLCEGGTFSVGLAFDQGIKKCEGKLVANANHTACEADKTIELIKSLRDEDITVPAGKYLPADKTRPVTCTWTTKYCPGGTFKKASTDQGVEDCPFGSKSNSNRTACTVTLSMDQMRYGPSGNGTPYSRQCWHQADTNDPGKYVGCVFKGK